MSSDSTSASSETRELSLISKVELRIALADSDEKLQALLQTYLAPLLLKLCSESLAVRNKVIAVCQHINTRLKSPSIRLPVAALLKQFKEQKSQLLRHFDLRYIQLGIDRLDSKARVEVLIPLLQGVFEIESSTTESAIIFNLVLRLLPLLKLPQKGSEDDKQLKHHLGLSDQDTHFLSEWLGKLLLLSPAGEDSATCPGLSPAEYKFLNKDAPLSQTWNPIAEGGLNLTETKATALRFLASGVFEDFERFLPAVIASADVNSRISDIGEEILKRFTPDLENPDVVQSLYNLYFGKEADGTPPARPSLQVRLLLLLGKSVQATADTQKIVKLIEDGLLSESASSSQGLQAAKLRTQIFTFTTWVVRMGSPTDLKSISPKIIAGLRDFIQYQGWPSSAASGQKLPSTDLSLRGLAYESMGILLPKIDFSLQACHEENFEFELIRWLFTSLSSDDSSSQISVSIEQALGSILNSSLDSGSSHFQEQLRPFLVEKMSNRPGEDDPTTGFRIIRSCHYAAVRFANRFLPYSDIVARWVDLMAVSCDTERQQEVVEEGRKGLHPYWYRLLNPSKDRKLNHSPSADDSWFAFPGFSETARFLLGSSDSAPSSQGSTVSRELSGHYRKAFAPAVSFVRNILLWEAFSSSFTISVEMEQDWDYKLDLLLSSNEAARASLKQYIKKSDKESLLVFLNRAFDGLVRGERESSRQCGIHFVEICSLASNDIVGALSFRSLFLRDPIYCSDPETQNTAARAFGILASHPSFSEDGLREIVTDLIRCCTEWEVAVGETTFKVRGAILAMSYLLSRLAARNLLYKVSEVQRKQFVDNVFSILLSVRDSFLRRSAEVAVGQFSLFGILSPAMLPESKWKEVIEKLVKEAKSESEISIKTLGLVSLIYPKSDSDGLQFNEVLRSIYKLHEIRSPEVQFSVGEALSTAAIGWSSKSLIQEFDVDEDFPMSNIPNAVLAEMCEKVISGCGESKPSLRKASAIWLLSLVKNCGHMQEMQAHLHECQATFAGLLGDRDEVVQESGAQGLGLVYDMGDQELKDDLVRDLVNSFTASSSGLGGGRVNAETELFDRGSLPTGEGSSVNTYKDIMNLAAEAGDPTLVYRFMSLASNNAIWTNRAAFGRFGISNILSDSSVNGYLAKNPKIYPKLYRYRFDPNPNVQRSMNTIWNALVKDSTVVIAAHFDEIMDDLLKSMVTGREWRVRQASCTAIADLIQGRQPETYAKYVDEILTRAFRVLDDIKETVRLAALGLCQTITNAIVRTLEAGDTNVKRASAMLSKVIPFLLSNQGIESSVQEAQAFAINTLIRMAKKSPGDLLRPFVPEILESFLNSLSSLEPQAVNYVHLNAEKYGLTGQEIDKMRLSSVRSSPMMEAIERYLIDSLDEGNMKDLATRLERVLRYSVGLPSKVGCSRVLALLSMKSMLFRPYADHFIRLMSKHVVDRNDTVSASYSTSMGYLTRLASDDQVLKTMEYTKDLYFTSENVSRRAIVAEILYSMSKLANDRFMAFATTALPFVFVCKHDTDEHVREVFEKTWQDNVGGTRTVLLYLREIVDLVSDNLDSPRWVIKHTAALAVAKTVMLLDKDLDLSTSKLVWPVLEKALVGKTWVGKEVVLKAFVKFTSQAKCLWQEEKIGNSIKAIAIREAKRNNATYRPHALTALGEISQLRDDCDFMPDSLAIVRGVLDEILESDGDRMDIDTGSGYRSGPSDTLAACVKCLLQCINPEITVPAGTLQDHLVEMTSLVHKALGNGDRSVQIALFQGLQSLLTRLDRWIAQSDDTFKQAELQTSLESSVEELLLRKVDVSVEAIRKERAQATLAYAQLSKAGYMAPERLRQTVATWWEKERSETVRRVLWKAVEILTPRTDSQSRA